MARSNHPTHFVRKASVSELHRAVKAYMAKHAAGTQFIDHVIITTQLSRVKSEAIKTVNLTLLICDNTGKNDQTPFLVVATEMHFPEGARTCTNPERVDVLAALPFETLALARAKYENTCRTMLESDPALKLPESKLASDVPAKKTASKKGPKAVSSLVNAR